MAAAGSLAATIDPRTLLRCGEASMPTRPLGKTGWKASILALGTAELPAGEEGERTVLEMVDAGVNYIDTAPSYQGTRSESTIGSALKSRRKEFFLATKTLARDAEGALAEVRQSLRRLQTDRIDLLQIHSVNDFATLDRVLASGGAATGLTRAKADGLIRFIGITGHTRPEVILKAIESFPFDSILVPVSALDASLNDFAAEVIPRARSKGVAVVGMKSLKGIERAKGADFKAEEFLRYALTLPVDTLTVGLRRASEAKSNVAVAKSFRPMRPSEMREIENRMRPLATEEVLWWKRR
jgi:aryl-alcohol dehydrogenase-like predicted oxidoreductase